MEKSETSAIENSTEAASTISTLDQQSTSKADPSTSSIEKPTVIIEDEEAIALERKRKKKEKVGRILTFFGLQIALFLAALDK
jgi:hypothetical protein